MRNTASVSLHCNGSRHLSLFALNSFLPLQFRGSSSDVIRGFKHRPLRGKRRGRDLRSGYKRQYRVNYSNSTGCTANGRVALMTIYFSPKLHVHIITIQNYCYNIYGFVVMVKFWDHIQSGADIYIILGLQPKTSE